MSGQWAVDRRPWYMWVLMAVVVTGSVLMSTYSIGDGFSPVSTAPIAFAVPILLHLATFAAAWIGLRRAATAAQREDARRLVLAAAILLAAMGAASALLRLTDTSLGNLLLGIGVTAFLSAAAALVLLMLFTDPHTRPGAMDAAPAE